MSKVSGLIVVLLLLSGLAFAQEINLNQTYTLAQLQADYDQATSAILDDHPMFFTDKAALDTAIKTHRQDLRDGMTALEFCRVLAPVMATVRCGHARMGAPLKLREALHQRGHYLPLEVRVLDGHLYVLHDASEEQSATPGRQILAINDHTDQQIITTLLQSLPADGTNETYKFAAMNRWFSELYLMFFETPAEFRVQFSGDEAVTLKARPLNDIKADLAQSYPEADKPYWDTNIADDNSYGVLTIRTFSFYDDPNELNKPMADFFAQLRQRQVDKLIVDLRDNDGGDPNCSAVLMQYLINKSAPYFAADIPYYDKLVVDMPIPENVFKGDFCVLINGEGFSSTGHLLSLLKYHDVGTFVGEESGGSYACNDASKGHVLDHTQVRVNVPRMTFATAVEGLTKGRGLMPDVPVTPTIEDLLAGRDVVLDKALEVLLP